MIPFAIANHEGMISIHSFHDPARGLTNVGLKRIFYCIMKLNETPLMTHVHCMYSAAYSTYVLSGDFAKSPLLRRSGLDLRRALQGSARSAIHPIRTSSTEKHSRENTLNCKPPCICACVGKRLWEAVGAVGSDPTKQLLKISNLPFANDFLSLFLSQTGRLRREIPLTYACLVECVYVYACIYVCTYMCTFRATDERVNTCACVLDAMQQKREMRRSGEVA